MNCIYCGKDMLTAKCHNCKAYQFYKDDYLQLIILFFEINYLTYKITHDYDDKSTNIYMTVIVDHVVKFKHILRLDLTDINPFNVKDFILNKLELYTLFS